MAGNKIILRSTGAPAKKPKRRSSSIARTSCIPDGQARLNLLLDQELKDYAKSYADRHHTNITQLIKDFFVGLREREDRPASPLVLEQELTDWAHEYAAKHYTDLTQMVRSFFVELQKREKGLDVDQI